MRYIQYQLYLVQVRQRIDHLKYIVFRVCRDAYLNISVIAVFYLFPRGPFL